jgi:two-component system chemotaxis response regulator CheB
VLIVDDSAAMRALIAAALQSDPGITVVGEAADPLEARQAIKALNPDVVTLDVEMPHMDGLEFLEKIMRLRPMPVIMVSSLTTRGADAAIRALEIGAVECFAKPSPKNPHSFETLAATVKLAARVKPQPVSRAGWLARSAAGANKESIKYQYKGGVVAIGSSTGGVEALMTILSHFPKNCPPTVITQHMPETFTQRFAHKLDRICAAHVSEAVDGAPLKPGRIYLAPGGTKHLEVVGYNDLWCRLRAGDHVQGHRPSVDVLFASVARCAGKNSLGVILTGMGRDGAEGLLAMRKAGARTIGQDEKSSVVYGMPKAAFEIGAVSEQLALADIPAAILKQ